MGLEKAVLIQVTLGPAQQELNKVRSEHCFLRHTHIYTNSDYYGEQRQNQGWGCRCREQR